MGLLPAVLLPLQRGTGLAQQLPVPRGEHPELTLELLVADALEERTPIGPLREEGLPRGG